MAVNVNNDAIHNFTACDVDCENCEYKKIPVFDGKPRTYNTQRREAGSQDQPKDQLPPYNDTRVWMGDDGKIPCEGQQK